MKTILAPIDFSPVSKRIVEEAAELARLYKAKLFLLHIVPPPIVTQSEYVTQKGAEFAALTVETMEADLKKLARSIEASGLVVETQVMLGFPGMAVVAKAKKLKPDYIVVGSHGHGAFYDLIIGGTTSRILKEAECPVIVVPAEKKGKRS
ncbi:MAG: universal stress protein [Opitutaceae bacterium]|nr:universal stress protein [Opitutaceae bacterium]